MEFEPTSMLGPVDELRQARIVRPRKDGRVGRSARVVGDMVVGEDGSDGGRSAGAAVGAALGGGVDTSGGVGVGGAKRARVVKRCWWVARVEIQVEWANEVVCATWEEIQGEVERAEADGRQAHWESG